MRPTLLLILLTACRAASVPSTPDAPFEVDDTGALDTDPDLSEVYDGSRLLEIEVELDPEDWEELRHQERNILAMFTGDSCMTEPWDSPYTWFEATVIIDGEPLPEPIEVRKKGLLGSVTPDRPSLKLDFDRSTPDQTWRGASRLTLNNGRQDTTRVKTCMGYELYAAFGLPASRCSLAHVTVNGESLGVYANVEPVKKPMLRRVFGSDEGALYEGTLSDFREGFTATFDDKNDNGDPADFEAVIEALAQPEDTRLAALDAVIDVEHFTRYWAAEALLGHWDSYDGNTNNFYIYKDPADGRFRFLPWGIDAILQGDEPFGAGQPVSVVTRSALAAGLYEVPEAREAYFATLEAMLETAWDEDALTDRLDELVALSEPALLYTEGEDWHRQTVREIKQFINGRKEAIASDGGPLGPIPDDTLREAPCLTEQGAITLDFATTWGSYGTESTFGFGAGEWSLELGGEALPLTFLGAVVGEYDDGESILFISGQHESGANLGVYMLFDTEVFAETGTIPADWAEVKAYLLYDGDGDYENWQTWAYLGGEIRLDAASNKTGRPVSGRLEVSVFAG